MQPLQMQDLEVFKQIPGYKAILKAVLKNQIQSLVQQLAQQTGEESVLITASLEEGTLSQLGSDCGKTFLDDHDEIKSQFLGFCIKKKQVQRHSKEFQASHYAGKQWSEHRSHSVIPSNSKRSHPYPISVSKRSKHISQNAIKPDFIIKKEEEESTDANGLAQPADDVEYSENANALNSEAKDELEDCSADENTLKIVESESSPEDVDDIAEHSDESGKDSKVEVNKDDIEYVYTGIDDTNALSDEMEQENAEEALDLKINSHNSNDSYDIGENEIHHGNSNYATEINHNDTISNTTSCDLTIYNRKPRLKLFDQYQTLKTEKSVKERKMELENYLNLENPDRPYPCNLCPKRFKERHHLVYHLRTHSGHRPYVCNVCEKSFTQSSSLNTHKKLHLKDMSCDYCGKVFRKISLLQNHVCRI